MPKPLEATRHHNSKKDVDPSTPQSHLESFVSIWDTLYLSYKILCKFWKSLHLALNLRRAPLQQYTYEAKTRCENWNGTLKVLPTLELHAPFSLNTIQPKDFRRVGQTNWIKICRKIWNVSFVAQCKAGDMRPIGWNGALLFTKPCQFISLKLY